MHGEGHSCELLLVTDGAGRVGVCETSFPAGDTTAEVSGLTLARPEKHDCQRVKLGFHVLIRFGRRDSGRSRRSAKS
jgi:hypothetical protein